ncbi:MAG: hypothetical protein ACYS7Y_34735 [Planctomycetota bacterium]
MGRSMIEVSCIYCGKPVRIEQSPACKHVECPACGHTFAVSRHKPDVTPRSAPGACTDASDEGEKWAGKSNEEITERLLSRPVSKEARRNATDAPRKCCCCPCCLDTMI